MSKLILHIGAGKTGSSAIQRFLQRNHLELKKAGVIIPDRNLELGPQISGNQVFRIQDLLDHGCLAEALQVLIKSVEVGSTVVVSAENLSNPHVHEHLLDLSASISIEAIIYIRRQDDLLASAWQQWHAKTSTDPHAWLLDAVQTYGRWADVAEGWLSVVGDRGLKVRVFERNSLVEADLFSDFLDACGLNRLRSVVETKGFDSVNPSYSDIITPLVAGNRQIFKDAHDNSFFHMVGELTGSSYTTGPKVSLFTADQREAIVRHYAAQNEAVRHRFFPDRTQLFEPIDHSKYHYLSTTELHSQQMRFLTEMVTGLYRKLEENGSASA